MKELELSAQVRTMPGAIQEKPCDMKQSIGRGSTCSATAAANVAITTGSRRLYCQAGLGRDVASDPRHKGGRDYRPVAAIRSRGLTGERWHGQR